MAECCIREVDGKFNYFENLDVARKAKLITQFIIYHIELQMGINFNLIQGGNNDIDHTDEEKNLDYSLNNKKNASEDSNESNNDVTTDNNVARTKNNLEDIVYNSSTQNTYEKISKEYNHVHNSEEISDMLSY